MSFAAGAKVTWADPLPDEPAWKAEQRRKWEAEFGPPPYTVKHTSSFRPGEDLVYTEEFYEMHRVWMQTYHGPLWPPPPPKTKWGKWVRQRSPRALVQSWFKLEGT